MRSAVFWADGSPQQNNFLGDILSKSKRIVMVGGNWNNGTNDGVFYTNANNSRGDSWNNTGFRLARAQDIFVRMIKVRPQIMSIRSMPPCFFKSKRKHRKRNHCSLLLQYAGGKQSILFF